jgi:hypothetical protein
VKVIYEKTILEKIIDAQHKALTENRKIERIEVTPREMNELKGLCSFPLRGLIWPETKECYVIGIKVVEVAP